MMENEPYGINIENAHKRAVELIPEEFFWSCVDELAPFGSDEGDTALAEYRNWRKANPAKPTIECLKWTIESVGQIEFSDYNESLLSKEILKEWMENAGFDEYVFTLDISVIATGFAQLVDEGIIELQNKPIITVAVERQIMWSKMKEDWEHSNQYISNLNILKRTLKEA